MSNTVLAINMIRGFCEDGYPMFVGESVRGIIPNVRRLLERESKAGSHVIYVCDKHEPDDPAFQLTVRHCVAGTPEVDIISELAHIPGDVIYKVRKSAFFKTDLDERLKRLAPEKLIVCGVPSNNYVLHTVADARNRDYLVEVPADCVAARNEEVHGFALNHMEKILGANVRVTAAV